MKTNFRLISFLKLCLLKYIFSLEPSATTNPVTYEACDVDTTNGAMDKSTGIFTAKRAGIYQFQFIARVLAGHYGHIWIVKGSENIALFGQEKDEHHRGISGSVITRLDLGQQLYANAQKGAKFDKSWSDRRIIFQGFLLAEL